MSKEFFMMLVENYIRELNWSLEATDYEKTLVIGNIRGFALWLLEDAKVVDITYPKEFLGA